MPMPVINESDDLVFIETEDIYCIYKDPKTRKITVTAECGVYYLPSTIDQILLIMQRLGFALIESNRIVNVAQVKEFDGEVVHVDGQYYYVSRRNRANLWKLIGSD